MWRRKCVPVLIARRLPFLTIRLLQMSGCLIHENYNQLYPKQDVELATEVRKKNKLGYHDVRTGNEPDKRMLRFVVNLLPDLIRGAHPKFQEFRDVYRAYGNGDLKYPQWLREPKVRTKGWGRAIEVATHVLEQEKTAG